MAITTGNWPKALWPGVKKFIDTSYNEWNEEWKDLVQVETSTKRYEEIVSQSGFGLAAVKPEGEGISYDTDQQGFVTRFVNVEYALGYIITKIMVEDDQYVDVAKRRSKNLAKSIRQTKENVVANLFNRADNASYTGADAVALLSTVHPNIAGGTYANELTTAADISEAALEQACIDIGGWTDDRGLTVAIRPMSLHIPIELEFDVERILKSPLRVGTAENDANALKNLGKFPKGVFMNHYFTDADKWFVRTDCDDGMMFFQRRKAEAAMDNDFDTSNMKAKMEERYSTGWANPRGIFGSPGA